MSWITTKLLGYRQILFGGSILPQRSNINFAPPFTVVDNPTTSATDVTITAADIFTDATHLAVADKIVKRAHDASANFAGTCAFGGITCTADAAITGVLSCHDAHVVSELEVGGGITCPTLESGDILATGAFFVNGSSTINDLSCTSLYNTGSTVLDGSMSVGGSVTAGGNIVTSGAVAALGNIVTTAGNITTTGGNLSCSGSATMGSIVCSGGASITGLATVGSMSCAGSASIGTLNVSGSATLGSLTCGAASLLGATTAANFTMTGANKVKLASRSLHRVINHGFSLISAGWTQSGTPPTWMTTTNSTPEVIAMRLTQPQGSTLTSVQVWIAPNPIHASLPATMPMVQLMQFDPVTRANTYLASAVDASASAGAFNAYHAITMSASATIDNSAYVYWLIISSEGGLEHRTG